MYQPTAWPQLAEKLAGWAELLDNLTATATASPTRRSFTEFLRPVQKRQTANNTEPAPNYAFQGVTCGDAIDSGNVTTKDVFDLLVQVTRTVSPMCTFPCPFCCMLGIPDPSARFM